MMNKLKTINMKKALKISSLFAFAGLIVLFSCVNAGLDPSNFDFYTWLSNSLILVGIMIFGLLMGESIGGDKQLENIEGMYQRNLKDYNKKLNDINPILIYFTQFYRWYKKKELYDEKVNYLVNHNVDGDMVEDILKHIKLEDLAELAKHAIKLTNEDGHEVFIEKQGEEQIEAIRNVLLGNVKVDSPNANYFLSAPENSNCKSKLGVGKQIDVSIKINKSFNRAFKIVVSLIVSLIWSMYTFGDFMDSSNAQAWMNLVFRILSLFTSLLSGWMSAVVDVKLKARKIKNKCEVLCVFESSFNTKEFVPMSSAELARLHYQEYEEEKKKEEEENLKAWENVVPKEELLEEKQEDDKPVEERSVIIC